MNGAQVLKIEDHCTTLLLEIHVFSPKGCPLTLKFLLQFLQHPLIRLNIFLSVICDFPDFQCCRNQIVHATSSPLHTCLVA